MNYEDVIKMNNQIEKSEETIEKLFVEFEELINKAYFNFFSKVKSNNFLSKVKLKEISNISFLDYANKVEGILLEDEKYRDDVEEIMKFFYEKNSKYHAKETEEKLSDLKYIDYEISDNYGEVELLFRHKKDMIKNESNHDYLKELEDLFDLVLNASPLPPIIAFRRYLRKKYKGIINEIRFNEKEVILDLNKKLDTKSKKSKTSQIQLIQRFNVNQVKKLQRNIPILEKLSKYNFKEFNEAYNEVNLICEVNIKSYDFYENMLQEVLKEYKN